MRAPRAAEDSLSSHGASRPNDTNPVVYGFSYYSVVVVIDNTERSSGTSVFQPQWRISEEWELVGDME